MERGFSLSPNTNIILGLGSVKYKGKTFNYSSLKANYERKLGDNISFTFEVYFSFPVSGYFGRNPLLFKGGKP